MIAWNSSVYTWFSYKSYMYWYSITSPPPPPFPLQWYWLNDLALLAEDIWRSPYSHYCGAGIVLWFPLLQFHKGGRVPHAYLHWSWAQLCTCTGVPGVLQNSVKLPSDFTCCILFICVHGAFCMVCFFSPASIMSHLAQKYFFCQLVFSNLPNEMMWMCTRCWNALMYTHWTLCRCI